MRITKSESLNHKDYYGLLQLITYALIGAANFLINLTIINLLSLSTGVYSGKTLYLFEAISFISYSINGYLLNKKFTFKNMNSSYFKYSLVLGISAFINTSLFVPLTKNNLLQVSPILWLDICKLTSSIIVGTFTFLVNKFLVFNTK